MLKVDPVEAEQIRIQYKTWVNDAFNPEYNETNCLYRIEGMLAVLDILKITIPGVNDHD